MHFIRVLQALPTAAPFQRLRDLVFALDVGRLYRRHPSTGVPTPISTARLVVQITRVGATESSAAYTATVLENGLGVTVNAVAYQAAGVYRLTLAAALGRASALRPLVMNGSQLTHVSAFTSVATTVDCNVVNSSFAAGAIPDGGSCLFVIEA